MEAAKSAYYAASATEVRVADAFAEADLARADLNELVRKQFGEGAAKEVTHAAGQWTAEDASSAKVIERAKDRADIQFANGELLPMIRVGGAWKVSVKDLLQTIPADPIVWWNVNHASAAVYTVVKDEIREGKVKDIESVKRELSNRLDRAAKNATSH